MTGTALADAVCVALYALIAVPLLAFMARDLIDVARRRVLRPWTVRAWCARPRRHLGRPWQCAYCRRYMRHHGLLGWLR